MSDNNGNPDPQRVTVEYSDEQWSALKWLAGLILAGVAPYLVAPMFGSWGVLVTFVSVMVFVVAVVACVCRRCRRR